MGNPNVKDCLVLSDTHGHERLLWKVAKTINFRPAAILFLGDGLRDMEVLSSIPSLRDVPLWAVSGNCDSFFSLRATESMTRVLPLFGHKIFMTHGHLYGVRGGLDVAVQNAVEAGADVFLYGHTHVAEEHTVALSDAQGQERCVLVANPGSLGEPRDGGGHRFGVLTLTADGALFGHGQV
ncbi:MAG: metallophosphoesterase family protein [Clostridia bacterium]|nr:metallophosphoesterase family protein [Clostridia bacterium]